MSVPTQCVRTVLYGKNPKAECLSCGSEVPRHSMCITRYLQTTFDAVTLFTIYLLMYELLTDPQPLAMRILHTVRPTASSLKCQYPLVSVKSPSSCLHLLSRLPATCSSPSILPSTTCFRRQFLHKTWLT